jgi:predicted nucleotide-binding protein (sugar kinase/HSP70/actin superfamily)
MPFTYPHFGSLTYVFESLLNELGVDVMPPIKPTKKTTELGSRYGPEFVCTPFKLTLGTFIEMLDKGADTLGMGGCNSYCRFGYYWPVQKLILNDIGYDNFRFVHIDYENPLNIVKTLKVESAGLNTLQTLRAFQITWLKNRLTDRVDELVYRYRALEVIKGSTDKLANKLFRKIVETKGVSNIRKFYRELPKYFEKELEIYSDKDRLKISVTGEIYVALEPALNLDVCRKLNNLGVIVECPITLRRFTDIGKKLNPFKKMHFLKARKLGEPYLKYRVGGESQENLGDIIYYKKQGFDGNVHLYPFTCMPEIITRSIAPEISFKYDMPFLSLVVDEHTGEAGFQTRLEAFVDLLKRKKEENKKQIIAKEIFA